GVEKGGGRLAQQGELGLEPLVGADGGRRPQPAEPPAEVGIGQARARRGAAGQLGNRLDVEVEYVAVEAARRAIGGEGQRAIRNPLEGGHPDESRSRPPPPPPPPPPHPPP